MAKGSALKKEMKCSSELREFLKGEKKISRADLMKAIWKYIKRHDLQVEENRRAIRIEGSRLEPLFPKKMLKKHVVKMKDKKIKVPSGCIFMTEIGGAMTEHLS